MRRSVGAGWGSADLSCDDCGSGGWRENSGVASFGGGFTVNRNVLVGAEFNLWTKSYVDPEFGSADVNFYNLLGTVTVYPSAGGFFVKGGAGLAVFDMDIKASGVSMTLDMGKGLGVLVGGGYDVPVGRVAVSPAVSYWYGKTGDLKYGGETFASGVSHNVLAVTVSLKFP